MTLKLVHCEWLDDWFVLSGGSNRASVEGPAAEWLEVAEALEAGKGDVHHKRLCAYLRRGEWRFWSPRNATANDYAALPEKHGRALGMHIRAVVNAYVYAGPTKEEA